MEEFQKIIELISSASPYALLISILMFIGKDYYFTSKKEKEHLINERNASNQAFIDYLQNSNEKSYEIIKQSNLVIAENTKVVSEVMTLISDFKMELQIANRRNSL